MEHEVRGPSHLGHVVLIVAAGEQAVGLVHEQESACRFDPVEHVGDVFQGRSQTAADGLLESDGVRFHVETVRQDPGERGLAGAGEPGQEDPVACREPVFPERSHVLVFADDPFQFPFDLRRVDGPVCRRAGREGSAGRWSRHGPRVGCDGVQLVREPQVSLASGAGRGQAQLLGERVPSAGRRVAGEGQRVLVGRAHDSLPFRVTPWLAWLRGSCRQTGQSFRPVVPAKWASMSGWGMPLDAMVRRPKIGATRRAGWGSGV